MALQQTTDTGMGFVAENAYHKVSRVLADSKTTMLITVESSVTAGEKPFKVEKYAGDYALDGGNIFEQAYNYLKKEFSPFENAVDC